MYKIIIPPALTVLVASIAVARLAVAASDLTLMHYAWGMAAFAGLAFATLLGDFILKGLHTYTDMQKLEVQQAELRKEEATRRLYEPVGHTRQWKEGFAAACGFFLENYLSGDEPGVTENDWFQTVRNTFPGQEKEDAALLETSYRTFMVTALMQRSGIDATEYDEIAALLGDTTAGNVLTKTVYNLPDIRKATEHYEDKEK